MNTITNVFTEIRYHSSRGEDSQLCGMSPKMACRTLLWILDNYYKSSLPGLNNQDRLKIITDTDLQISGPLLFEAFGPVVSEQTCPMGSNLERSNWQYKPLYYAG